MNYRRPYSKKLIADIERHIFETAETYLRLYCELDAVRTGIFAKDVLNPKYGVAYKNFEEFCRKSKSLFLIEKQITSLH